MKTKKSLFLRLVGKFFITVLYICAFALFLYLPLFLDIFAPSKTINICVFAETFSRETINRFEKKTGIKVNVTYAEIDEQVYAKFRINQARDYDVVNISDFMVYRLVQQGLLHKLDYKKIPNISLLDQRLMHRVYDPENVFSVPHEWYAYGLVYEKSFFQRLPKEMSLAFVFKDPQDLLKQGLVPVPYKLCMLDDGRDAVFMAALYLFDRVDNLSSNDFMHIKELLIKQKKWVEAYTVHSSQYFLFSNATPLALMSSNYMRKLLDNSNRFDFAIPKEGSMLIIENLAIPQKSRRADLAHQFINFMISDAMSAVNSQAFGYNSSNVHAQKFMAERYPDYPHLLPEEETFERLIIPLLPQDMRKIVEEIWLSVGFA